MENKLGNVSEDTIQTIVPCFYLQNEKINSLEKKMNELEKKSVKTIKDILGKNCKCRQGKFKIISYIYENV